VLYVDSSRPVCVKRSFLNGGERFKIDPKAILRNFPASVPAAFSMTPTTMAVTVSAMPWQHIRITRFGGPEVLELAEEQTVPAPGPGEVRIKVLAVGTGFTDTFIPRGRYSDFKGPLPFTPGYDLVGVVETTGPGVTAPREGQLVADLCVVGGYAQYAIRPARFLVPVPSGVDPAEAVCIPLAYLTAFQMLTRYRRLPRGAAILVIGASGTGREQLCSTLHVT
jgi:D-arabinose 1-dehydrogenase-like Zn-dependent alcohol dehydrogenase